MSLYLLLNGLVPSFAPSLAIEEHAPLGAPSHGGNAPAEVLLVFLIMIVIWGAFRITSKKRP
jgi:hypothetical protein